MVLFEITIQTLAPRRRTDDDYDQRLFPTGWVRAGSACWHTHLPWWSVKDGPASSGCYVNQRLSIMSTLELVAEENASSSD